MHGLSSALLLLAVIAGGAALAGCHGAPRDTVPTQPFRDEVEPGDGFQYTESATPAGDGEKASGSGSSSETTVEIEIDEESSDGADAESSDEAATDEAATDEDSSDEDDEGDDGASRGVTGREREPAPDQPDDGD